MTPQPECASCGATEINYVYAAWNRWRKVLGLMRCGVCAKRFPEWMRQNF